MSDTTTESEFLEPEAATELKMDLQSAVQEIVELEDDHQDTLEAAADRAMHALIGLKKLKLKLLNPEQSVSSVSPPTEFKCPLSGELMTDPVVVSSGQTYDRPLIQRWLKDGNLTCPKTGEVLRQSIPTPNNLLKEMIFKWCKEHGVALLSPVQEIDGEIVTNEDHRCLNSLFEKLSSSHASQLVGGKEIRELTKKSPAARALFAEIADATSKLLKPLLTGGGNSLPELQEDLITAFFNLSIHESNKKIMAENPEAIPVLIEALKSGTIETRMNAAAAFFSLSALDSNKHLIGKSGALKPLIELLEEGHALAMRDAAQAIFNLCTVLENKSIAVSEGAVMVIVKKINDNILVDELLAILAMLSTHHKAVEEMEELGAVPCLLRIIRESTNQHSRENCIAMLVALCQHNPLILWQIGKDQDSNDTISQLAQNGNSRTKRKAKVILLELDRYAAVGDLP